MPTIRLIANNVVATSVVGVGVVARALALVVLLIIRTPREQLR
ncbi:MAG: hypothetical protein AAF603_03020 [Pseudomonadota bacterium]